ncbi:MAG TPA: M14 family metallopeptidase [Alphaproteobacteria bacterium]|jgi:hypothetical protein
MDVLTAARACFPRDYAESRRRFLRAAKARGAELKSYLNPNRGPDGGRLATDCAWLGPRNAKNVLVLMSGTHGVEGFCGAGALLDVLTTPPALPRGLALLLIHAINPYGFAWIRRVTEDGVDLNRNFVDFAKPPANPGYDALADAILPAKISGPVYERAQKRLRAYMARHGMPAFNVAMSGGQYRHPKGLFYGGTGPTWSHRTQAAIIAEYALARRRRVAVIDYHTGLGPHGYGDILCAHMPETRSAALARKLYGENLSEPFGGTTNAGQAAPGARHGFASLLWQKMLGGRVAFVGIEYGTYDSLGVVRPALVAEHWLHAQGPVRWRDPRTRKIKAQLRKAFYPDTDAWREAVLWRSRQAIRMAVAGLTRS